MKLIRRMLLLTIVGFVYLVTSAFVTNGYSEPNDKRAIEAAEDAVKRLGPERGGIQITSTSVDIIGLESVAISGEIFNLEKTLEELGARKVGTEIHVSLSGDVLFDFDKWDIKEEAEETLRKLAKAIIELNKRSVLIEGHTDSKGSESYNLRLSERRAKAVKNWLTMKVEVKNINFQTRGYGESRPVTPNTNPDGSDNPEGRAKNRRVEIRIMD